MDACSNLSERTTPELRAEWEQLFGQPPPVRTSREFLIGNLSWRRQANEHRVLGKAFNRRAERFLKENEDKRGQQRTLHTAMRPGTRLFREWRGETHEVTILEKGFAWRGERYRSLSRIASEITGSRWSGPRFFGLLGTER